MDRDASIAIVGLGLMGGSLAMALKRNGHAGRIVGASRRPEVRAAALAAGAVDVAVASPAEAAEGAAMVVLCAPVMVIPDLAAAIAPRLHGAVVTDVGSTKGWVLERMRRAIGGRAEVVGSHPIAGSERQGFDAARADLYEGAVTVVTPDGSSNDAVGRVEAVWRRAGSRVVRMSAAEHDRRLARTSHVPHLAAALVAWCAGAGGDEPAETACVCGPGFRDTTRVAEGSPEIWHDILVTNRDAIEAELQRFAMALDGVRTRLRRGDFGAARDFLAEAREARRRLLRDAAPEPTGDVEGRGQ